MKIGQYRLVANIPGVKVTVMPDPLNAKTEMTEAAKREFAWRVIMNYVFDNVIYSAHFSLDPANKKFFDSLTKKKDPHQEAFETIKRFVDRWFEAEGESDRMSNDLFEKLKTFARVDTFLHDLNDAHCGDCTAVACSCSRCHAESMLGIDTLMAGKMVNNRLAGLYFEETATQEEKAAKNTRAKEFAEKYPSQQTPEERQAMIDLHQPRWDAETKAAIEVYALHKSLIGTTGEFK